MWHDWELESPQVKLYLAVRRGEEEKIREALREYHRQVFEQHKIEATVGQGIYEDGLFLDTAILSGRRHIVRLLLELGFQPVFYHGKSVGDRMLDQAVGREYHEAARPVWERYQCCCGAVLRDCNGIGRPVWPIADEEMFRMQIEAMEDINSGAVLGIVRTDRAEEWTHMGSWQVVINPAGFAMLTGNADRVNWLLERGAELGMSVLRERELRPLLNPFGRENKFCAGPLELAVLSCHRNMVELALKNSSEAAFYWAGKTVRGTGRRWYPKPWQCGKQPWECSYCGYRMERAVNLADRPMWDFLWEHFENELSKIPIVSALDMGGGELAELLFEKQVQHMDGAAHMAELEQWAAHYLDRDRAPEYRWGVCRYFARHRQWYKDHMGEAHEKLRAFLLGVGWHEPQYIGVGTDWQRKAGWLELSELLAEWETDIGPFLKWYNSDFRYDLENLESMAACLRQLEREFKAELYLDWGAVDWSGCRRESRSRVLMVLITFRNRSSREVGLDLLKEVCDCCDLLLPEPVVEAVFVNGYLTEATYMELLQYLEEQEKYDMIAQVIRGNNRFALSKPEVGQAGSGGAEWESLFGPKPGRSRDKEMLEAHRLEIYRALRRGRLREEAKLLRQAGNGAANGRLMEAVRSSCGRFLEPRLRVRFWNQVCEFDGDLNLVGVAAALGNLALVRELLGFWKELGDEKRNPQSAYLTMEISSSWQLNEGYHIRLQYREGGEEEQPGGIVTDEASPGPDTEYHLDMARMGPAALAIAMGRCEIVRAIDELGLLSDQEVRRGLIYTGSIETLEYLNRSGRLAAAFPRGEGLEAYLGREQCWNWIVLEWLTGQGILNGQDCRELSERLKHCSLPREKIREPLKKPCRGEDLQRACELALTGKGAGAGMKNRL